MGNMIISNARKALEHRIDKYFMDEEVMAVPRSVVNEWLDSQAAITYFECASQFNKEHKDHVHELEAQLAQCKESYADAKNSRDRLQAQLDSAKYDCLTCDAKAELQTKVDDLQAELSTAKADNEFLRDQVQDLQAELGAELSEQYRADMLAQTQRVAELQAQLDAYDQTHMLLPVDTDGVPIKIGDKIQQLNHAGVWTDAMPVIAVDDHGCFALAHGIDCDARTYVWGNNCRHVKPRTVEDVLRDGIRRAATESQIVGIELAIRSVVQDMAAELRGMGVCDE